MGMPCVRMAPEAVDDDDDDDCQLVDTWSSVGRMAMATCETLRSGDGVGEMDETLGEGDKELIR